ncbi:MAG: ribonuclease H-like domain-containing protein [Paenibacillaceae bacterium]
MSLLQERLNRFRKTLANMAQSEQQDELEHASQEETKVPQDWDDIDVTLMSNEAGSFLMRKRNFPLQHRHGQYELGELLEFAEELRVFHPDVEVSWEQLLFFDTETTGLGVGAGNVPFMIGMGYYEQNQFVTEQFFIRNPAEELAMLRYFNSCLERFTHIVSYNGRTFDWPIVQNRYVLNRMKLSNPDLLQLDFLYASRSFWRNTLPSCRLSKVEEERLGFSRLDDVPGSLAPTLYFQYLAEKRPSIVFGVFVHNEHDILSLAGLAIHFCLALLGKLDYVAMEAEELFRIGLWLDKMGKVELAEGAFAVLMERPAELSSTHWLLLAAYYKKKGQEQQAVKLWSDYIALERNELAFASVDPYIELAMYYEHRVRDYRTAFTLTEKAFQFTWKQAAFLRMSGQRTLSKQAQSKQQLLCEQLQKRLDRLRKKL